MLLMSKVDSTFASRGEEDKLLAARVKKELVLLAGLTGANINKWNVEEFFSKNVFDVKAIRKTFAEKLKYYNDKRIERAHDPGMSNALSSMQKLKLQSLYNTNKSSLARSYAHRFESTKVTLVRKETECEALRKALIQLDVALRQIKAEEICPYESAVEAIIAEGFWTAPDVIDNSLTLETKAPIVLTHVNQAAGINIVKDLGKFVLHVALTTGVIRVRPFGMHLTAGAYTHPHVYPDGTLCLGDYVEDMTAAVSTMNLEAIYRLVAEVIGTFNHRSPYATLGAFTSSQDFGPRTRSLEANVLASTPIEAEVEENEDEENEDDLSEEERAEGAAEAEAVGIANARAERDEVPF